MGIPAQHSWSSHIWLLSHGSMIAFLSALLAALEELLKKVLSPFCSLSQEEKYHGQLSGNAKGLFSENRAN